mgnify:CR=1 FL=1
MFKILNNKGFTLIELVIVISIIFILATVSNYSFRSVIDYFKLKSNFREIYANFLKARQLAIINQERFGIAFDVTGNKYTVFRKGGVVLRTINLSKGIKYVKKEIDFGKDNKMRFTPMGTAEGGHITITNNFDKRYTIIVYSHTGRVRFEKN